MTYWMTRQVSHSKSRVKTILLERDTCRNYSWRSKKTEPKSQIDLILDRADRIVNICEIKYSHEPYLIDKDEAMKLKLRTQNFLYETGSHQTTHLTFITPYGLRQNQHSLSVVKSLTSDDLFR